jgi:hypothetical protein
MVQSKFKDTRNEDNYSTGQNRSDKVIDESSTSYDNKQSEFESDVTKLIKESIERSIQLNRTKPFDTTSKQLTKVTLKIVNELPKVAIKTGHIAMKMASIGKESIISLNDLKNNQYLRKKE